MNGELYELKLRSSSYRYSAPPKFLTSGYGIRQSRS